MHVPSWGVASNLPGKGGGFADGKRLGVPKAVPTAARAGKRYFVKAMATAKSNDPEKIYSKLLVGRFRADNR
jgi:hypothetical protein